MIGEWVCISVLGDAASGAWWSADWAQAWGRLAGRLHVLTVHFPIAMLIVAAVVEVIAGLRKRGAASTFARACVWIGAAGACAAAGMGWLNAAFEYADDGSNTLEIHRWLGVATAAVALFAAFMSLGAANANLPRAVGAYRAGVVLAAMLAGIGAHFGGVLVHGDQYVMEAVRGVVSGGKATSDKRQATGEKKRSSGANGGGANPTEPTPQPSLPSGRGSIDFVRDVWPILEERCVDCHGDVKRKGKLRLDSREAALKGGKNGAAIVVGDADASLLVKRVLGLGGEQRMPVDDEPLSDEETEILKRWIREGAEWPQSHSRDPGSGEEEVHWAYVKATKVVVPKAEKWGVNEIDGFVKAKLDAAGLSPSREADRATLIRRVSLDLIGLPPTVEEVEAFEKDANAGAYERVVDRLLASPRYGEKWARMWLDLARYADSHGYEKDNTWSMWPYRDWVIQALNADMPFDRFTIEQLAGDLLPDAMESQRIATGFNRCSMINEEGGVDPEEGRYTTVVDRVNTTATVWLGTTLACAQCHDHKFDPFTMKDYYAFFAFFNNTPVETKDNGTGETAVISPKLGVKHPMETVWKAELAALEQEVGPEKEGEEEKKKESEEVKAKRTRIAAIKGKLASEGTTQVMEEMPTPRETRIVRRGNFMDPGEVVEAATPEALPPMEKELPRNRLGLARWIASAENPLTGRVLVNRVWMQYFGRGIVETDEDFGTRGSEPTHPELLDFLATDFSTRGWSLKRLHRTIVTSATYRQASGVTPEMLERDPVNALYARGPRFRLEGEAIRDQALAIGGLLSAKVGGPSVFPPQVPGIWGHAYSAEQWTTSTGEDRYRRGLYTFWKRATPYPTFVAFDAPSRQVTCTRRPRTNTALQALTTLNDPVFLEAAAGLAKRAMAVEGNAAAKAAFAFRACTARSPTKDELATLIALYAKQAQRFRREPGAAREFLSACGVVNAEGDEAEWAAWTMVGNVLLNLDEVLTKE